MLLTDLPTVLRRAGLNVVEVDGWRTRGHGQFAAVETIVCHHTAGPASGLMPSLRVVTHGRSDLPGPLCNLGLGRDGTVYVVAAGYAFHAGTVLHGTYANDHSIGIEAEATGVTSWPEVQMKAYARLCAALCEHYGIPVSRVLGHKEVAAPLGRKIDPNFDMASFRRRVELAKPDPEITHGPLIDHALEDLTTARRATKNTRRRRILRKAKQLLATLPSWPKRG